MRKTDVLPLDDATKARQQFKQAASQPLVLFVTVGQGQATEALVALADDYAGDDQDARRGFIGIGLPLPTFGVSFSKGASSTVPSGP